MHSLNGRSRFYSRPGNDTATCQGGAIAQLGERVVRNDEVGGSIPPGSTMTCRVVFDFAGQFRGTILASHRLPSSMLASRKKPYSAPGVL